MIKGLIFDLDGVLVDTKEIHFLALNEALQKIKSKSTISYEDHSKNFDGLPTLKKLTILHERAWIKKNQYEEIAIIKQQLTEKILKKKNQKKFFTYKYF